ncbi:MAG: hypothetical protein LBG06_04295 [Deltaproteobacteria bacterium]|jgi:nitrogenase molybdenum-iron protein alpha/beta subunit|nr:hypothetical protein [Deltaproteobacteria bacterium]
MGRNLASITENPCKMCLPLGVVSAFYGVERAMSLLHGSQGCSTYIRRHMATHYNEPVDIASSSLSEEGAVFGGAAGLVRGLDNLIRVYGPAVVAVATTCLAETIGEDVPGILGEYAAARPGLAARLVSVPAPGYGGTHFEGWWIALRSALSQLPLDGGRHDGVNVIAGPASPADVRALRELLEDSGLAFTLFPDISDNLDGPYDPVYSRLPLKGTPLAGLIRMAGARATLELTSFCPGDISPGAFLEKAHGVPLHRLDPPVGLRGSDALLERIAELGGRIPRRVREARGRFLDAMADSHKYCALGRAAVAGDPDFVYGVSRLCAENGIVTVLAATGARNPAFARTLRGELEAVSSNVLAGEVSVRDGADYALIGSEISRLGANILVGSSEPRHVARKLGIPLVRATFPVHDHVGGQRLRTFGYAGAAALLDGMVNSLVSREEEGFRERLRDGLFRPAAPGCAAPRAPARRAPRRDPPAPSRPAAPAPGAGTGRAAGAAPARPAAAAPGHAREAAPPGGGPRHRRAGVPGSPEAVFRIAVVSRSSVVVDGHFGQAERVSVYESDGRGLRLLECREVGAGAPACGGPGGRRKPPGFMDGLVEAVSDCHAAVALRFGDSPRAGLEKAGVRPYEIGGSAEEAALAAARLLQAAEPAKAAGPSTGPRGQAGGGAPAAATGGSSGP